MIQSTNRLSRSARLRRPRPSWIYGVIAVAGVALGGVALMVLRH